MKDINIEIELLKQNGVYQTKKIDEMHKVLVGDGSKVGLVTEMNEIRGALKFTQVGLGLLIGVLGIIIVVMG